MYHLYLTHKTKLKPASKTATYNKVLAGVQYPTSEVIETFLLLLLILTTGWSTKNEAHYFCPYLRQSLTDFQHSFTGTCCG